MYCEEYKIGMEPSCSAVSIDERMNSYTLSVGGNAQFLCGPIVCVFPPIADRLQGTVKFDGNLFGCQTDV